MYRLRKACKQKRLAIGIDWQPRNRLWFPTVGLGRNKHYETAYSSCMVLQQDVRS